MDAPDGRPDAPATVATSSPTQRSRLEQELRAWGDPRARWMWATDGAILAVLVLVTVATRWAHRSEYLWGWDSGLFALGLEDYDVGASRPHAPGYPIYEAMARLVHPFTGEANASLVLLSVLASAAAVALLYGFMRALGSRRAALAGAGLFVLAPVFVFNGVIALSYALEAAASVGVAWLAWRMRTRPNVRIAALLGACWSLAIGIRPSLLFFLTPVVAYVLFVPPHLPRVTLRRCAAAAAGALAATLAWFVPMLWASGGWDRWREATSLQSEWVVFADSVWVRGLPALREHVERLQIFLDAERVLLLPLAVLVVAAALFARRAPANPAGTSLGPPKAILPFLAFWLLPSLLFYLLVFNGWDRGPTGYILVVLPGLYAVYAWSADALLRQIELRPRRPGWGRYPALVALPLLVLPAPHLVGAWDPYLEAEVRAHDAWAAWWSDAMQAYPANETAILTYYSWTHVKWYFPDYLVWGYFPIPRNQDPPNWELFLASRHHADDVPFYEAHARGPGQAPHAVPAHIRTIILFDFQLAGPVPPCYRPDEESTSRLLREEINVTAAFLPGGGCLLLFRPDADHPTLESYFRPLNGAGAP